MLAAAARNLPRPHRSPSHSGQPLSPVPICCAWAARSDPVPFLTVLHVTPARACLLVLRVAAWSFFSRLRPAARNLPRPRRSPSHSGQPLPLVPVCSIRSCLAPNLTPYDMRRACLLQFLRLAACGLRLLRLESTRCRSFWCAGESRKLSHTRLSPRSGPRKLTRTRICAHARIGGSSSWWASGSCAATLIRRVSLRVLLEYV